MRLKTALGCVLGVLLVVGPWTVRNLAAVYRSFDWNEALRVTKDAAGLSDRVGAS